MFLIGHRALQKALRKSGVPPSYRQQKNRQAYQVIPKTREHL